MNNFKLYCVLNMRGLNEDEEMTGQQYCLRWNNYQSNMTSVFHHLLKSQAFVDVTLACNEQSLKAHKVVLSACSSYFQKLLMENPCKHPTIIMPQDICFADLKFIIEFVYKGEIDVSQTQLQSLLKTADQLKIKGLCEVQEASEGAIVTPIGSPTRRRFRATKRRLDDASDTKPTSGGSIDAATSTDGDLRLGEDNSKFNGEDEEMAEVTDGGGSPEMNHSVEQTMYEDEDHTAEIMETKQTLAMATVVAEVQTQDSSDHAHSMVADDMARIKLEHFGHDAGDGMMLVRRDSNDGSLHSNDHSMQTMMITPELLGLLPSSQGDVEGSIIGSDDGTPKTSKNWTQEDMDAALDALRNQTMSLTKASLTYGIPSTTLWQRAHRLGIDTPKKDGPAKSWTEDSLNVALEALRSGTISANKASKAYGIPSSTLYKIARREGIRLAAPFNATPTTWNPDDLERALEAIRSGQTTVQKAAANYGIPSGTLYGRCKREGIGLTRNNPTPWSEQAMNDALEAVRIGQMSINQAAIHFNLPYSSLYGRFKRVKYEGGNPNGPPENEEHSPPQQQQQQTSSVQTPPIIQQQQQQQHMMPQYPPPQQQPSPVLHNMYSQPTSAT